MTQANKSPRRTPLALTLKAVGYLTGPSSVTGKTYLWWEEQSTRALGWLALNPTYLRLSGAMMRQGFRRRAMINGMIEDALHRARMPALSDMEALERRLARVLDKVEALEHQLEYATRRADAEERAEARAEDRAEDRAEKPAGEAAAGGDA